MPEEVSTESGLSPWALWRVSMSVISRCLHWLFLRAALTIFASSRLSADSIGNGVRYVLGNHFIGKVMGAEPVLSRWRAREGEPAGQNRFCTDDRFQ